MQLAETEAVQTRAARRHIFKPIWITFGGYNTGRCWYIFRSFGLLYGHLVYFMLFAIFLPVFECYTKQNLATLVQTIFFFLVAMTFSTLTLTFQIY
jgi:hypothetical protein